MDYVSQRAGFLIPFLKTKHHSFSETFNQNFKDLSVMKGLFYFSDMVLKAKSWICYFPIFKFWIAVGN